MKRAMARQAEAEREKRAKIIAAEGESAAAAALGQASDIMMQHPLALQLRNLQSLVEIGVDKNTTVVFPAPLMSTISDLGAFLQREAHAATPLSLGGLSSPAPDSAPADALGHPDERVTALPRSLRWPRHPGLSRSLRRAHRETDVGATHRWVAVETGPMPLPTEYVACLRCFEVEEEL